jgi:hypothetical protein
MDNLQQQLLLFITSTPTSSKLPTVPPLRMIPLCGYTALTFTQVSFFVIVLSCTFDLAGSPLTIHLIFRLHA